MCGRAAGGKVGRQNPQASAAWTLVPAGSRGDARAARWDVGNHCKAQFLGGWAGRKRWEPETRAGVQGFLPEERLNAWLSARHIITKTMIIADVYEVFTMSGAVPDT